MSETQAAHGIEPGDHVDPVLFHASVLVALPGSGTTRRLSPAEVLARVRRPRPPSWARAASLSGRIRLREALARRGFDWRHRLDDRTLLACDGQGGEPPFRVLEIGSPGPDLDILDVGQLESAIDAAPEHDPGETGHLVRGEFPVRITAAEEPDLPEGLLAWRPGPVLVERYRLITVFDRLALGSPVSSVTLLPGESRRVRHRLLSKALSRESSALTAKTAWTEDLLRELRSSFEDRSGLTLQGEESREIHWSLEGEEAIPALEAAGSRSRSFERMTSFVLGSIESVEQRRSTERESLLIVERSIDRRAEEEREEEFLLKNSSPDQARTWISFHVLGEHVVHLDLVAVDRLLVPGSPGDPLVPLPADETAASFLAGRYGGLGIFEEPESVEADGPHPNDDLSDRRLLLSLEGRPRRGPLPVCLLSRRVVARTGFRFVKAYADPCQTG